LGIGDRKEDSMRLSIFIGLLYVAWCINPMTFDTLINKHADLLVISFVVLFALLGDLKDLNPTGRRAKP
jgi:hypothetical protein